MGDHMKLLGLSLVFLFAQASFAAESSNIEVLKIETATTSKTSVEDLKPSKWRYSLDSEFYMNQQEQKDKGGDARLTSLHLASGKYAYNGTTTLKIVPTFELNYIPLEKDRAKDVQDEIKNQKTFGGARFHDPFLAFVKKDGTLWGSDVMTTEVRYYIPVSEVSREVESAGMVRLDYMLPWTVGNWNLAYYLNPRLNLESQSREERPSSLSFREFALGTYSFSDSFSSYLMVGHMLETIEQNFLHNEQQTYVLEVGATKYFSKNVSVTLYMDNLFTEGKEDVRLLAADQNDFALATSLTF